jgi:UDP-N-acetylmuramyl pentapeptide phosphotransferase/UDP-N-acetylglucosamine-1-phosphate transferase
VKRLKALPRLLWQIAVAVLVVAPSIFVPGSANPGDPPSTVHYDQGAGVLVTSVQNPFGGTVDLPLALGVFFTIFWIVGTTNAINWIDGLDGLAASVSAVASAALFVVTGPVLQQWSLAYLPLILLAAVLGFLPYNLHPAKIFMGDSGAMFLGFTLAVLSVIGGAKVAAALLVLGVPILDGAYMIVYRLYRGQSPATADRQHLHHRLFDIGFSQGQVVIIYMVLCGVFGTLGVLPIERIVKLAGMVLLVVVLFAIFAYISRRQFDERVVDRTSRRS